MALLLGYGAAAINPYLAFETIEDLILAHELGEQDLAKAIRRLHPGLHEGCPEGDVEDGHLDVAGLPWGPDF